jgi:hypothetical protein
MDAAEIRGSTRVQSMRLDESTWPALKAVPFESEKEVLWAEVCQLHKQGWVQLKPEATALTTSGYAKDVRISVANPQAVRAAVGMPERVKSAVELWRAAVNEHLQATDAVKAIVSGYCIELPGRSAQEVVERLNGLRALAQSPLLLREVSAQLFWGMSKVLDNRQALVAAILGVSTCPFPESPVQLLVKLPAGPLSGVLFIENQMSFEQASRAASPAMEGLALAFAAGFRGSARRLRSEKGSSLYYAASSQASEHARQQFEGWLYGESAVQPVYFWGDLDWSGMRILRALRQTFENAQAWVTGYRPMLQALQSGQGHAPLEADKQGQAPTHETGCPYADNQLVPALANTKRFVDQELFSIQGLPSTGHLQSIE